jgi:hypothetical protein
MTKRVLIISGAVAAVFSIFVIARLLAPHDFNPTTTIKFGEQLPEQNEYAEALLGYVVLAPMAGHDGKYFFVQAMDPLYLEADVHAVYLDRPSYRAQRMAYPTLASLGGLLPAEGTAWGLIVVNVVAMVVGTIYTGLTAVRMGTTPWLGLAFLLNPGLIVDLSIDGAGVVAMAAMIAGVYYMVRDRLWLAATALSVAALGRETMLIAVFGLAAFVFYRDRRVEVRLGIPVAAVAVWWLYVHWRLEGGLVQDTQALGLPFQGFADAFKGWLATSGNSIDLVVACALMLTSALIVIRAVRTPTLLGWAVSGFALLGTMLSEPVWRSWFDSARALAPVLSAFILLIGPAVGDAVPKLGEQAALASRQHESPDVMPHRKRP